MVVEVQHAPLAHAAVVGSEAAWPPHQAAHAEGSVAEDDVSHAADELELILLPRDKIISLLWNNPFNFTSSIVRHKHLNIL